jgi:hypothetical protein
MIGVSRINQTNTPFLVEVCHHPDQLDPNSTFGLRQTLTHHLGSLLSGLSRARALTKSQDPVCREDD